MIGWVDGQGVPIIQLTIAGKNWTTVIDTGFNSDFELPTSLFKEVVIHYIGTGTVQLAGGRTAEEEFYRVRLPFDGQLVEGEASFVTGETILLGTRMLRNYRLVIDFPAGSVLLERQPSVDSVH